VAYLRSLFFEATDFVCVLLVEVMEEYPLEYERGLAYMAAIWDAELNEIERLDPLNFWRCLYAKEVATFVYVYVYSKIIELTHIEQRQPAIKVGARP
jgi:hypothetical protein